MTMNVPLEIEFKDMEKSDALEAVIRGKVDKLEEFHDRIMRCHVVVEAPHRHQQQGKQFHVNVRLTVPGGELVSSRHAPNPAHEDANVAVRDAFDAIRRQLEDHVRIQRGEVKTHSTPQT
jgi:ribosomal subunit interface protein